MEFSRYVREQNLLCRTLGKYFVVFQNKHQPCVDGVASAYLGLVYELTLFLEAHFLYHPRCLVQLWRAEEVANSVDDFGERHFQLTTRNQPFILHHFPFNKQNSEGIYSYRMKARDVIITGDGRGGAISRVFKNKRMEVTPDVAYYSYEEYPQRDLALSCHIKSSIIVPLSDSYGRTVGVMEFVSQSDWPPVYFMDGFLSTLSESNLTYLEPCKGLCGQYDLDKESLCSAVSEMKEVIEVLCESFDITIGQTWMLCKHCNSLSTSKRCAKELGASYQRFIEDIYLEFRFHCILREGEGVVGRAAMSSHNLVYCENVAKFSITEYPFAHGVRKSNLSTSFAICLISSLSRDQVYVLEFFLGSSYGNWGLGEKLVPILDKMRQSFRTFKVAYGGEEIGDNLSVLVVDAISPDKVETLKNDTIDLTSAIGIKNVQVIDASSPVKVETLEREMIDLTLAIGVKNVEAFNLPYYLEQSIGESSINETDDPMIGVETPFQDISMDNVPVASDSTNSTVQSAIKVTIKANYGGDFFRFQLSSSSGIHELYRQVSQRLELMERTYDLRYRDEDNDLILLTCDEDLQLYISSSTKQGNYTLLVSIEPKCASPM